MTNTGTTPIDSSPISSSNETAPACRGRPRDPGLDDEILDAAVQLIAEGGVDALTMDAVARRAGVAKASIYRRFASKVDLLAAACAAVCPALPESIDTGSVRDDLLEILRLVVESFKAKQTNRVLPTVLAEASTNSEVKEALTRFTVTRRSRLAEAVRRGVDRGELAGGIDEELLVDQLVGAVLYRNLVTARPLTRAVLVRLVDQVLDGATPH
jgi:AcrR family transcriptional regulator